MDEGGRVKNIKEKFEVLNFNCDKPVVTNSGRKQHNVFKNVDSSKRVPISNNNKLLLCDKVVKINQSSNIKRTPAFRREKTAHSFELHNISNKHSSIVDDRVKHFSNLQHLENEFTHEKRNISPIISGSSSVVKTKIPDIVNNNLKLKTKANSSSNNNNNNGSHIAGQLNIDKNKTTPPKIITNSESNISETLRKVLRSPLPAGPPPKKPPRTFISYPTIKNNKESNITKNFKTTELNSSNKPTSIANNTNSNINKNGNTGNNNKENICRNIKPVRSKTELEIMLNKIEVVSKPVLHSRNFLSSPGSKRKFSEETCVLQNTKSSQPEEKNLNLNTKPLVIETSAAPASHTKISDKIYDYIDTEETVSCFGNLNFGPCVTKENIYAEPATSRSNFFIDSPESVDHIYEEVMTTKDDNLDECKMFTNSNEINFLKKDSLYYMSTPVDSILEQSLTISDAVEHSKSNLSVSPISNLNNVSGNRKTSHMNGSANNVMDQKIRMWVNEVYAKPWTKIPDGGSDSDSVVSATDDNNIGSGTHSHIISDSLHEQVIQERKGYVKRVATRAISRDRSNDYYLSSSTVEYKHIFECLILVGLDMDSFRENVPYVKMKYPPDADIPQYIENLCFPDAYCWPIVTTDDEMTEELCYTVILTTENGQRKYAYCRRVKPEGTSKPLPLIYCILSSHRAKQFYFSILEEVESRHGQKDIDCFIKLVYQNDYPAKGHSIRIPDIIHKSDSDIEGVVDELKLPVDIRLEDLELSKTLFYLRTNVLLQIFCTLLIERKVILLSNSVSKLSTCIDGLQMALFPFQWQHMLISIVPSSVISVTDLCQAPTPYCIGLLKSPENKPNVLPSLNSIHEVIVVDVDECKILHRVGDENSILPYGLLKGLKSTLQDAKTCSSDPQTNNILVCEAFTRLFVELIGHYRHYIILADHSRRKMFQKEAFIRGGLNNGIRLFLEWFAETAMFTAFIESRLHVGPQSRGIFEQRCNEFNEEIERSKNVKKPVIKQIGDRFKDWTSASNV